MLKQHSKHGSGTLLPAMSLQFLASEAALVWLQQPPPEAHGPQPDEARPTLEQSDCRARLLLAGTDEPISEDEGEGWG